MRSCIVVSASRGYLAYLNAFLNSIQQVKLTARLEELAILVVTPDLPEAYFALASQRLGLDVRRIPLRLEDTPLPRDLEVPSACKASRYFYLLEYGSSFDVACLMDADLFLVSGNFGNLFQLAFGTRLAIGCNERYKWEIDPQWTLHDRPLFDQKIKLQKFHCNTPLVLCVDSWREVIRDYLQIVYQATQQQAQGPKVVGDLFAWNIAVRRCNREADVVLLPMESMTQVHQTGLRPWTRLEKSRNGFWTTYSGEEVLCIHGRPDRPLQADKLPEELRKPAADYYRLIQVEWNRLNTDCGLPLQEAQQNVESSRS